MPRRARGLRAGWNVSIAAQIRRSCALAEASNLIPRQTARAEDPGSQDETNQGIIQAVNQRRCVVAPGGCPQGGASDGEKTSFRQEIAGGACVGAGCGP